MYGKIKCGCGCGLDIDSSIKSIAENIEKEIGQELDITSGARCPVYNATVKGAIAGDAHERCKALDVFVDFSTPVGRELGGKIITAAVHCGIKRFGIAKSFLHIDCVAEFPSPRMWLYY